MAYGPLSREVVVDVVDGGLVEPAGRHPQQPREVIERIASAATVAVKVLWAWSADLVQHRHREPHEATPESRTGGGPGCR